MLLCRRIMYYPLPPVLINGIPLPYNHTVKFLGLLVDAKLKWQPHIRYIRSKLSSACGIMHHIRNKIPLPVSKMIYYSIAFPYINYCSNIWASANTTYFQTLCAAQNKIIRLMAKIGRRANTSPVYHRLKLLKIIDILKVNTLMFVYKAKNGIIVSPFEFNERNVHPYNLRTRNQLHVPNYTSNQSERFLYIRGTKLWNELSVTIRDSPSIYSFKMKLKKHYLDSYHQ